MRKESAEDHFSLMLLKIMLIVVCCSLSVHAAQSDREKAEGLPVAPFMDREKVTKPTAQIGFIKFVLIPMFETVMKVNMQDSGDDEGQSKSCKVGGAIVSGSIKLHLNKFFG